MVRWYGFSFLSVKYVMKALFGMNERIIKDIDFSLINTIQDIEMNYYFIQNVLQIYRLLTGTACYFLI